ncbi:MAG: calcium-translocating P-type ATPase, PMCA-type [Roseburia sp.]|nr:calcium-translocating P-type ATPase, PMCA-type [Roseburia sp.]
MDWYNKSADSVLDELETSERGLSETEAQRRRSVYGENKLAEPKKQSVLIKFLLQFTNVMVIVLIAAAIVSAVIAVVEKQYSDFIDVAIILAIVILNAVIGTVQECKAEKAMESLKKMSAPFCKVRRDGEVKKTPTSELVVGDVVILEAGDVAPADMRIIKCASLKAESSTLTGESVPSDKFSEAIDGEKQLADRDNMLYSSNTVTYGRGEGVVTAIGMSAEIGKIADMLSSSEKEITPLQKKLNAVGKFISIAVLIIAAAVFVIGVLSAFGTGSVTADAIIDSFMTAVALAVAAIPESLTAVITIIMALGVQKLSKENAVVKKLPAVETLGSTNVICSDKTGTLTLNKMTVEKLYADGAFSPDSDSATVERLLKCMCLCNDTVAKSESGSFVTIGDPTETALVDYAHKLGVEKTALDAACPRVDEIPFDSERKLMTTVNREPDGDIEYTKGAADELIVRCTHILDGGKSREIAQGDIDAIIAANKEMADAALRVLAYAYKKSDGGAREQGLTFIGLSGMIDPPREEVNDSVALCKSAGITVVMITGDNLNTAVAIASALGICENSDQAVTGADVQAMTDNELVRRAPSLRVYARVSPEHKVRIVKAWKANGMIVAMTGDGVNDAPSIKAADIGVGMGITGTEVTKEAADMVLADDNFATIVTAVRTGRTIFSNMQKTVQYLLAANLSEVLSLFLATLIFAFSDDPYVFLLPLQILWVNLVTDSLPALALGLEPPEGDVMASPPRSAGDSLFSGGVGVNVVYQGILQTCIVLGVFLGCAFTGWGHEVGTTMAFLSLCFVQLFHAFNARSLKGSLFNKNFFKNKTMFIAFFVGAALTVGVACIPFTHDIFSLQWLNGMQWLTVILCSLSVIPAVEIAKAIMRLYRKKRAASERKINAEILK